MEALIVLGPLTEFILSLTLIPWCIIVFGFGSILYCTFSEKYWSGTLLFALVYALLDWQLHWEISKYVFHNPKNIVLGIGAYCLIGLWWSIVKFYVRLLQLKKNYFEAKENWMKYHSELQSPELEKKWEVERKSIIPSFSKCCEDVIWWMMYWPFSIISYTLQDAIYHMFEWIFNTFSGIYRKLYNNFTKQLN